MRKWLIHSALILIACSAMAQERSLSVSLSPDEILIGEQVEMVLTMKAAAGDSVKLPELGDTLRKEV